MSSWAVHLANSNRSGHQSECSFSSWTSITNQQVIHGNVSRIIFYNVRNSFTHGSGIFLFLCDLLRLFDQGYTSISIQTYNPTVFFLFIYVIAPGTRLFTFGSSREGTHWRRGRFLRRGRALISFLTKTCTHSMNRKCTIHIVRTTCKSEWREQEDWKTDLNRDHFKLEWPTWNEGVMLSHSSVLRWLLTVSSTFLDFDGFISWCYNHGIKWMPNEWWTRCHFCDTICYHSNSITCWKHP